MRLTHVLSAVGVLCLWSATVHGQFMAASGNSFDPEISTVSSGVLLDAQAVVSADRKYVTMNIRTQNSALVALRDFTFQTGTATTAGGSGLVGTTPTTPAPAGNAANARATPAPAAPPPARRTILDRPGMTRLDRR